MLAAASLPGTVRDTDGCREIQLCRKISCKHKKSFIVVCHYFALLYIDQKLCLVRQVFQNLAGSFAEQRRPVMTILAAIRRRPELSQEQCALRIAWDRLEQEVRKSMLPNASCVCFLGH